MEINCKCGNRCIKPVSEVLKDIDLFYKPCNNCKAENIKKFSPLADQINLDKIDNYFGSCKCGKRHLDVVMSHVLKVMIDEGIKDKKANLRNSCIPLVTLGYPINSPPYLSENSLVILSNEMDKKSAERIVKEVGEVKGVLKGDIRKTVGIKDSDSNPHVYELLAGCDLRCDIIQTPYGALGIYKYQHEIHVEFPRIEFPKIEILEKTLKNYDKPAVLDCTCGPGTLGITCLKAGAHYHKKRSVKLLRKIRNWFRMSKCGYTTHASTKMRYLKCADCRNTRRLRKHEAPWQTHSHETATGRTHSSA